MPSAVRVGWQAALRELHERQRGLFAEVLGDDTLHTGAFERIEQCEEQAR
jgi:hypothetical protein